MFFDPQAVPQIEAKPKNETADMVIKRLEDAAAKLELIS